MSDYLIIDREEAELLLTAFNKWWIPKIKTDPKPDVMKYDKMAKSLRYFLENEDGRYNYGKSFGVCASCGLKTVLVKDVGLCGPCCFGEANTANGEW